jgi:choline dehydrogenase-like flavoprotein
MWEYQEPLASRNNGGEATFFWKSNPGLDTPDLQTCQVEGPVCSAETRAKFNPPAASWTLYGGVVRPKSRGQTRLTGPNPDDPIQIEANTLSHPDDLKAAVACVELCREIGNSPALRPFTKRSLRGRVTRNQSKLRGFPRVCGNPGCEWCARLGPAIFPDNTLRELFSPAGTTHPCLLQLTQWMSIS